MYDIYYLHGTACVLAWGDHDQLQAAPPAAEDIWYLDTPPPLPTTDVCT